MCRTKRVIRFVCSVYILCLINSFVNSDLSESEELIVDILRPGQNGVVGHEQDNLIEPPEMEDESNSLPCGCGRSNDKQKIVGGTVTGSHEWPWMAAIGTHYQQGTPITVCGGSIISTIHILTAAHCLELLETDGLNNFLVYVGDNRISGNDSTGQILGIQSVRAHPKYNKRTFEYDAAVVTLATPLTFHSDILPICLGQRGNPFIRRTAIVAGWGTTMFAGQRVNVLRDVMLRIIGNKNCSKTYAGSRTPISRNKLCAFYPNKGSCQGDSGGPLYVKKIGTTNIYTQVGIVSYGIGCADNQYPEVYTRVQRIISWIRAVTRSGRFCKNSFA